MDPYQNHLGGYSSNQLPNLPIGEGLVQQNNRQFASIGHRARRSDVPSQTSQNQPTSNLVDFEEDEDDEDPSGQNMHRMKKVNFNWAGIKCGDKNYSSPTGAKAALSESKKRISEIMNEARQSQVLSFKQSIGSIIAHEQAVINMPRIRITAPKNVPKARGQKLGQLSRQQEPRSSVNLGGAQRDLSYDGVSAHHQFDKNTIGIRSMHKHLCSGSSLPTRENSPSEIKSMQSGSQTYYSMTSTKTRGANHQSRRSFAALNPASRGSQESRHNISQYTIDNEPTFGSAKKVRHIAANQDQVFPTKRTMQQTQGAFRNMLAGTQNVFYKTMNTHDPQNNAMRKYKNQLRTVVPQAAKGINEAHKQEKEVKVMKMHQTRMKPRLQYIEAAESDGEKEEAFTVNPADDIPRNKLVDKLARGLQSYITRAQKREGFRVDVTRAKETKWTPPPRECATITSCDQRTFLMGGMNFEAIGDIVEAKVMGDRVEWEKVNFTKGPETIKGRQCHSSVGYNGRIYTFGGCFMFSQKRMVRECTNQLVVYDIQDKHQFVLKTKGLTAHPRKNHLAIVYGKSMLVYGGQQENGTMINDMLVLHLDYNEWAKLSVKNPLQPFIQGGCCNVTSIRKSDEPSARLTARKSDQIQEGIYFFGGKNAQGEPQNKLKLFKPATIDGKVVHGEFVNIKTQGNQPVARFGHSMGYLPTNNSIFICGGRNDEMCKVNATPFLNDMFVFLLDQKFWLSIKHSQFSDKIDFMGNQCMTVVTDGIDYENIVVFGGIANAVGEDQDPNKVQSFLSNTTYLIQVAQRSAGLKFKGNDE